MGTWGTKIYEDDAALDVHDEFLELHGKSVNIAEIESRIESEFIDTKYPDGNDVVILALCCSELETGTLTDATKEKALEIIASERQIKFWQQEATEEYAERRKLELDTLKTIIEHYAGSPVENDDWNMASFDDPETMPKTPNQQIPPKGALGVLYRVGYALGYICLFALVAYGGYLLFFSE